MKIEIDIDEEMLRTTAALAFKEQFKTSSYGRNDAIGIVLLTGQVQDFVRNMDFAPYIQAAAKAKLDDVVNQVVEQALRESAKKKAKQMQADGSLFA
jgi:hypothetical protein